MTEKNKPTIRFKGFTDAWEQRKLGEITDRVVRKNTSYECSLPLTISAQYGLVDQITFFNNRVASRDVSNYYLVKKGEFAYNKSYSDGYPFGVVKRLDRYNMGVLSTLYIVFGIKPEVINTDYLVSYYDTNNWHKQVAERAAEGARNHGLLNISADDFFDTELKFPKELSEQARVGTFFQSLDNLITLHQRKCYKLVNIKNSMLEKMFPQNGSSYPEVRFEGFTDAWEQRELETIYDKIRNAFVGTATPYYVPQGNFYLESNNVKDGQINRNSEIFINDEFYLRQKDNWLRTGDMVMVQSGHVGHAAVIPPELNNSAAHALIIFSNPKEIIDPYFLNYQYQTSNYKKAIDNITTGNTIKHILSSEMKKFTVLLTKIEEQNKISEFFIGLDNLITLHQRELDKLKNIKKACLEKMFI